LTELKPEFLISPSTQIYVDFPIGVASIVQDVIPLNSNADCFLEGTSNIINNQCKCASGYIGSHCQYTIELFNRSFMTKISSTVLSNGFIQLKDLQDPNRLVFTPGDLILIKISDVGFPFYSDGDDVPIPSDISATITASDGSVINFVPIGTEVYLSVLYVYYSATLTYSLDLSLDSTVVSHTLSFQSTENPLGKASFIIQSQSFCQSTSYSEQKPAITGGAAGCTMTTRTCNPGFAGVDCEFRLSIDKVAVETTTLPYYDGMSLPMITPSSGTARYSLHSVDLGFRLVDLHLGSAQFPVTQTPVSLWEPPSSDPSIVFKSKYRVIVLTQAEAVSSRVLGIFKFDTIQDMTRVGKLPGLAAPPCHPNNTRRSYIFGLFLLNSSNLYCFCKTNFVGNLCQTQVLFLSGTNSEPYRILQLDTPQAYPQPIQLSFSTVVAMTTPLTIPLSQEITLITPPAAGMRYCQITFSSGEISDPVTVPTNYFSLNIPLQIQTNYYLQYCMQGRLIPDPTVDPPFSCQCVGGFFGKRCEWYTTVTSSLDYSPEPSKAWRRGEAMMIVLGSLIHPTFYPQEVFDYQFSLVYFGKRVSPFFTFDPTQGITANTFTIPNYLHSPVVSPPDQHYLYLRRTQISKRSSSITIHEQTEFKLEQSDCDIVRLRWNIDCPANSICNASAGSLELACNECQDGFYTITASTLPCNAKFKLIGAHNDGNGPIKATVGQLLLFQRHTGDAGVITAQIFDQSGIETPIVIDDSIASHVQLLIPGTDNRSSQLSDMMTMEVSIIQGSETIKFLYSFEVYQGSCHYVDIHGYEHVDVAPNTLYKCNSGQTNTCLLSTDPSSAALVTMCDCLPGFGGPTCQIKIDVDVSLNNNSLEGYVGQKIPITLSPPTDRTILPTEAQAALYLNSVEVYQFSVSTTSISSLLYTIPPSPLTGNIIDIKFSLPSGAWKTYLSFSYTVFSCSQNEMDELGCNRSASSTCIPRGALYSTPRCICDLNSNAIGLDCQSVAQFTLLQSVPPTITSLIDVPSSTQTLYSGQSVGLTFPTASFTAQYPDAEFYWFQENSPPRELIAFGDNVLILVGESQSVSKGQFGYRPNPTDKNFLVLINLPVVLQTRCDWFNQYKLPSTTACVNVGDCNLSSAAVCQCKPPQIIPETKSQVVFFGQYCEYTLTMPLGPFYNGQDIIFRIVTATGFDQISEFDLSLNDIPILAKLISIGSSAIYSTRLPTLDKSAIINKSADFVKADDFNAQSITYSLSLNNIVLQNFKIVEPCYWTEVVKYGVMCPTDMGSNGQFIAVSSCVNPETNQIQCMCREGYNTSECRLGLTWLTPATNQAGKLFRGQPLEIELEWKGAKLDYANLFNLPTNFVSTDFLNISFPTTKRKYSLTYSQSDSFVGPTSGMSHPSIKSPYSMSMLSVEYGSKRISSSGTNMVPELSYKFAAIENIPKIISVIDETDDGVRTLWGLQCPHGVTNTGCYCPRSPYVFGPDCSFYLRLSPYTYLDTVNANTPGYGAVFTAAGTIFSFEFMKIDTPVTRDLTKEKTWEFPSEFHFEYKGTRLLSGPAPNTIVFPPYYSLESSGGENLQFVVDSLLPNGNKQYPSRYLLQNLIPWAAPGYQIRSSALFEEYRSFPIDWVYEPAKMTCGVGYCGYDCVLRCKTDNNIILTAVDQVNLEIPFSYFEVMDLGLTPKFYLIAELLDDQNLPIPQELTINYPTGKFLLPGPLLDFNPEHSRNLYTIVVTYLSGTTIQSSHRMGELIRADILCSLSELNCIPSISIPNFDSTPNTQADFFSSKPANPETTTPITQARSGANIQLTIPAYSDLPSGHILTISIKTYPQTGSNTFSPTPTTVSTIKYTIPSPLPTDPIILPTTLPSNLVSTKIFYDITIPPVAGNPSSVVFTSPLFTTLATCHGLCQHGACSSTTQKCSCTAGWTGETCANGAPLPCSQCHSTHTERCGSDNSCVCKESFGGQFCDVPKICVDRSNLACNAPHGFLKPNDDQSDCTSECECKGLWTSSTCSFCSLQCMNGGVRYKDCDKCGCLKGFSGQKCQCKSVLGKIVMNGYNQALIQFFKILSSLGLKPNSPLPDYLNDLSSLHTLININVQDVMYQAMDLNKDSVVLTTSSSATNEKETIFELLIVFNCPESNPDVGEDQLKAKWDSMVSGLTRQSVIQEYFIFDGPGTIIGTELNPTDNTIPDDDDILKEEENGAFHARFFSGTFFALFCFFYLF
jgi:hypothetical protein